MVDAASSYISDSASNSLQGSDMILHSYAPKSKARSQYVTLSFLGLVVGRAKPLAQLRAGAGLAHQVSQMNW